MTNIGECSADSLTALLPHMAGKKVLVVGDLCLDEYVIGRAQRLSREAPVPILEFERREHKPGAAANPALNIASLGSAAVVVGAIGDDDYGRTLCRSLEEMGIDTSGVIVDRSRPTTVKMRVLAEVSLRYPQQIIRVDRQERRPLAPRIKQKLIDYLRASIPHVDAVLLSDYKGGVVEQQAAAAILQIAATHGKVLTVDSQGDLYKFKGFTVVKCNRDEAQAVLRKQLVTDDDFSRGGRRLQRALSAGAVLITRGSDGMTLVDGEGESLHIPAANRSEVFDVTGAGDTVIAALTLALVAGGSFAQAALLSSHAAGLVVRRLGNATTTPAELERAIRSHPIAPR
ncbi:MAG: bifunctional hydroxymethylpyrimidine kinase/phosphomethylpyrimidine kinase [Chloroflexi bacterium]|nr:bifunctional hydroxymethylpyrimidine kinase/phosphomethylpyrimidine kinase [Chloroflexota bacterium]